MIPGSGEPGPALGGRLVREDAPALFRPQGLAGSRYGIVVVLAAITTLLIIVLIDIVTPQDFSVSALSIFPVLVCAWLLGARSVLLVTIFSLLTHVYLASHGDIAAARATVHVMADLTIAIVGRVASVNLASVRASRERELRVLLDAARSLNSATGLDAVLTALAAAAANVVSRGGTVTPTAAMVQPPIRDELPARVAATGRPAVLSPAELWPAAREAVGAAAVSVAVVPIQRGSVEARFLCIGVPSGAGFQDVELRLLEGIADLGGLAIANAQRLALERLRVRTFQTLQEVAAAVAAAADPRDVASLVVAKARDLAGAASAVLAWQGRTGDLLRVLASSPEMVGLTFQPKGSRTGAIGRAFQDRQPVLVEAPFADAVDAELAGDAASLLAVPLLVRGEPLGVLAVCSSASPMPPDDRMTIGLLASQLAPLINQSRLQTGLDQSAQQFRSLYQALGCGVLVHSSAGKLLDANWAAENLLGLTAVELEKTTAFGAGWSLRLPNGSELPDPMRPPTSILSFGRPVQNLVALVTPPGGKGRWMRLDSSPVSDEGKLRWVVTSFFEVAPPAPLERAGRRRRATDPPV